MMENWWIIVKEKTVCKEATKRKTKSTVRHGLGTIQVWRCFTPLLSHSNWPEPWPRRNSTPSFRDMLHSLLCKWFILQQDNEPKHTSKLWRPTRRPRRAHRHRVSVTGPQPHWTFIDLLKTENTRALELLCVGSCWGNTGSQLWIKV